MKPIEKWNQLVSLVDSEEKAHSFWTEYYALETENYKTILKEQKIYEDTFVELAKYFSMDESLFAGFLDGINTSLKQANDIEALEDDTVVKLDVDFEKLYFNMMEAKAKWLYTLDEWDTILSPDKRIEIAKEYKSSQIAVSEKVERNAPCPCGSGKKYKKCCGL